jgi:hypothetical protein
MDLNTELKNLGAQQTMSAGKYATGKSFRDSIRDMDKQAKLLDADKDVRSVDMLQRAVADAEAEFNADPTEAGKLMKYVDALVRTEKEPYEDRAIEVLEDAYNRTQQFRFRANVGRIRINQLNRKERALSSAPIFSETPPTRSSRPSTSRSSRIRPSRSWPNINWRRRTIRPT